MPFLLQAQLQSRCGQTCLFLPLGHLHQQQVGALCSWVQLGHPLIQKTLTWLQAAWLLRLLRLTDW